MLGKELQAYAASGIRSDHEMLTVEEGRERLRAGIWLLIREASMARNLQALLPLVAEYGPSRIAFCTDDRDPEDIADNGHVNGMYSSSTPSVYGSLAPNLWSRTLAAGPSATPVIDRGTICFTGESPPPRSRPSTRDRAGR